MKRGFSAMSPEQHRKIASAGGKAAHDQGKAHEFTGDEARSAGRKGGEKVSSDREHMREIGRKGGAIASSDRDHMSRIGRLGGQAHAPEHMAEIGRKGGLAKRAKRDPEGAP
jgi:hypothetical protein